MALRGVWTTWILAVLVSAGCTTVGHDEVGIGNFDQVSPDLYRGAQPAADAMPTLAGYHIKTVINLRDSDDSSEAAMVHGAGMNYVQLPLNPDTVTAADAEHFLALLAHAPGPVFVHCLAGRDRTGLAVAAYRIRIQGWSEDAALRDLYDHGHNWFLYPKVRAAISQLGKLPRSESQSALADP